jgi:hypothetical protein
VTYTEAQECFNTICSEYIHECGGVGELLVWLRKLLEKELMDKEPYANSTFDYAGNIVSYFCLTREPGTGYFRMSHDATGLEHIWLVSELLVEQYGVDVDDPDLIYDLYEVKDLSVRCMNEFYQFKFYASHVPLPEEDSGSM